MIGQILNGRYQVLHSLSNDGLGHTYIAADTKIPGSPNYVVKHLQPVSNVPTILATARRLFACEAEVLAKIGSHDQIPQTLAYFEENQQFFLVQEFVDGQNLAHELTPGKRWSEAYVIALLQDVLPVLEFIHQQGVIHRDLKPEHIIRRNDGKLVLIDFGAVKQVFSPWSITYSPSASLTISIGTPGYMPTEQGRGKPRPQSDIYALGMICIQALTGLFPGQLQENMHTGEMLWYKHAIVSPELAQVLSQMVRYHFKDRYQSATEVIQALQQSQFGIKPIAPKTSFATKLVYALTLEWVEAGQLRSQTIRDCQYSKHPGTIRIGRNPQRCDIVISEPTVSGLHVEIFFNPQQQSFYVRCLRQTNPPLVNGRRLLSDEVKLDQGSNLTLGRVKLRVSAIASREYPADYMPIYAPQQQKIPPAHQQSPPTPISLLTGGHINSNLPLLMGVGVATVMSAIGGLGIYKYAALNNSSDNSISTATNATLNYSPSSVLTTKNQHNHPALSTDTGYTILDAAKKIADSGNLLAAIAKAKEVSPVSLASKEATSAIASWQQQLEQASSTQSRQITQCQESGDYFQQGIIDQLAPEYIAACQKLGIQITTSASKKEPTTAQKQTTKTITTKSWKCYANGQLNGKFLLPEGQYPYNDPLFAENHCQQN